MQTRECEIQFCNYGNGLNWDIGIGLRAMGLTPTIDNFFRLNLGRRILRYFRHLDMSL